MTIGEILPLFDKVCEAGGGWKACCPAHDDHNPSLSIAVGDDGRTLLKCRSRNCSVNAITAAVGLKPSDLFARNGSGNISNGHATNGKPATTTKSGDKAKVARKAKPKAPGYPDIQSAVGSYGSYLLGQNEGLKFTSEALVWEYENESGDADFAVARFNTSLGKRYIPFHLDGREWRVGDPPGTKGKQAKKKLNLYGCKCLKAAFAAFGAEGEKACDRLREIGIVCTTSAHGAGSAHRSDWSQAANLNQLTVWPDKDAAGMKYAAEVASQLAALPDPPTVVLIDVDKIPDLQEGDDAYDFIELRRKQGKADAEIRAEIDALPRCTPPAAEAGSQFLKPAKEIEPAGTARWFLLERQVDSMPVLRFWRGGFYRWSEGRYVETEASEVQAELIKAINRHYIFLTTGIVANVMAQVRALSLAPSLINPPAWIERPSVDWPAEEVLPTRNKLIHIPSLLDGKDYSIPASPKYFTQTALDYDFNPDVPAPAQWLRFLWQLWGDDWESIATLQEWFGYCLLQDTSQQKILMLIGPPRSGKGTIARILELLIGRQNVAGPTLASFESGFGLAPLLGKSLAIVADARLGSRVDQSKVVERLLSISGEDTLTVDRKYREPVTGKIPTRLMIVSNELPRLAESSGALANRIIVLRLMKTFLGQEDTELSHKLATELPGILMWAIAGWQILRQRGHFRQPASSAELVDEMGDLCSPIGTFLKEYCDVGPEFQDVIDDVYAAWCDWCKSNGREHAGTKQTFGRDLRAAIPNLKDLRYRSEDDRRYRVYQGLRVKINI